MAPSDSERVKQTQNYWQFQCLSEPSLSPLLMFVVMSWQEGQAECDCGENAK